MIHIGLIEDNSAIREQFYAFFMSVSDVQISILADSFERFEENWPTCIHPSILFLDIDLPGVSGLEALPKLKVLLPETDIIMFTVYEDSESLIKAFCGGATGYLLKGINAQDVYDYVHIVQKGGSAISAKMAQKLIQYFNESSSTKALSLLNEKEYQVLELLAEGWSYKLIADKTNLSTDGVRFYIKRIYRALNVNSKGEALRIFYTGDLRKH